MNKEQYIVEKAVGNIPVNWHPWAEYNSYEAAENRAREMINGKVYTEPGHGLPRCYFGTDDNHSPWVCRIIKK